MARLALAGGKMRISMPIKIRTLPVGQ